jgi:hypothetical protein
VFTQRVSAGGGEDAGPEPPRRRVKPKPPSPVLVWGLIAGTVLLVVLVIVVAVFRGRS